MKVLLCVSVVVLSLLATGNCGGCPDVVKSVDDWKIGRFLGLWFEVARTKNIVSGVSRCNTDTYALRGDGDPSKAWVITTAFMRDGKRLALPVEIQLNDTSSPAHVYGYTNKTFIGDWTIIDTDYDTYGIDFVCTPTGEPDGSRFSTVFLYIRQPVAPSDELMAKFRKVAESVNADPDLIEMTPTDGCY